MSWPHLEIENPNPKNEFSDLSRHKFDIVKSAAETLNMKTLVITMLSVLSTILCHLFNITMNVRTDLIGVAVIFPIGIGINGAFKRQLKLNRSSSIFFKIFFLSLASRS